MAEVRVIASRRRSALKGLEGALSYIFVPDPDASSVPQNEVDTAVAFARETIAEVGFGIDLDRADRIDVLADREHADSTDWDYTVVFVAAGGQISVNNITFNGDDVHYSGLGLE